MAQFLGMLGVTDTLELRILERPKNPSPTNLIKSRIQTRDTRAKTGQFLDPRFIIEFNQEGLFVILSRIRLKERFDISLFIS